MHVVAGVQARLSLAAPHTSGFGRSYGRVGTAYYALQGAQQKGSSGGSRYFTGTRLLISSRTRRRSYVLSTAAFPPPRSSLSLSLLAQSSSSASYTTTTGRSSRVFGIGFATASASDPLLPTLRRLDCVRAQTSGMKTTYVQTAFLAFFSTMHGASGAAAMVHQPLADRAVANASAPRDPNTLSNYNAFVTKNTSVHFEIDFENSRLSGGVNLTLESLTDCTAKTVVLDTSYLDISDIKVDGESAEWQVGERQEPYGSPLTITLAEGVAKGKSIVVQVSLSTTSNSTALQWMTPAQTSNKKHPYMFSQCQAIHARSVFPCQDTPDVKSTFKFALRSPLPVVASGLPTGVQEYLPGNNGTNGTLLYTFQQDIPIPSYLFAVASGDLANATIGPRSSVWTGPNELQASKDELDNEIEPFMDAVESTVKLPYQWTVYNVLILPASFPYGGMENPVWTYATPSIISGDKQNVDVIAHELSHSWSGNLVSTASWEHFWLNEGWTTYLERRIQGIVHGEEYFHFSAIIGWSTLEAAVEQVGADHEYSKLVINLKGGGDPDDSFSSVPYEKGFIALYEFELLFGREKWDAFIAHYFDTWKFKSLDSFEFKDTLINFFKDDAEANEKLANFDWDKLFYAVGLPAKPVFDDTLARPPFELAEKWKGRISGNATFEPKPEDTETWVANQAVVFLEEVQAFASSFSAEDFHLMGETYGFLETKNIEVLSRFLGIGLLANVEEAFQPTAELLGQIGRMKFVRPLYRALAAVNRELALETFEKNRDFYHPIARAQLEKDLGLSSSSS